jgi:hypothetical protein
LFEQTSWILFLKYLDDLDKNRQMAAALSEKAYTILGSADKILATLIDFQRHLYEQPAA